MNNDDEVQALTEQSATVDSVRSKVSPEEDTEDSQHVVMRPRILLDKAQVPETSNTDRKVVTARRPPPSMTKPCHVLLDQIPMKVDKDSETTNCKPINQVKPCYIKLEQNVTDSPSKKQSVASTSKDEPTKNNPSTSNQSIKKRTSKAGPKSKKKKKTSTKNITSISKSSNGPIRSRESSIEPIRSRESSMEPTRSRSSSVASLRRSVRRGSVSSIASIEPTKSRSSSVMSNSRRGSIASVETDRATRTGQKRQFNDSKESVVSSKRAKTSAEGREVSSLKDLMSLCRPCFVSLERATIPPKSTPKTSSETSLPTTSNKKPKAKKSNVKTTFAMNQRKKKEAGNKGKLIVASALFGFMKTKKNSSETPEVDPENSDNNSGRSTLNSEVHQTEQNSGNNSEVSDDDSGIKSPEPKEESSKNSETNNSEIDTKISVNSSQKDSPKSTEKPSGTSENNISNNGEENSGLKETFFARLQRERREREEKAKNSSSEISTETSTNGHHSSEEETENNSNSDSGLHSGTSKTSKSPSTTIKNNTKEAPTQDMGHSDMEIDPLSKSYEEFNSNFTKITDNDEKKKLVNSKSTPKSTEKDAKIMTENSNEKKNETDSDRNSEKSKTTPNTSKPAVVSPISTTKNVGDNKTNSKSNDKSTKNNLIDSDMFDSMVIDSSNKKNGVDPTSSDVEIDPNIDFQDSLSDYLEIDQDMDFSDTESESNDKNNSKSKVENSKENGEIGNISDKSKISDSNKIDKESDNLDKTKTYSTPKSPSKSPEKVKHTTKSNSINPSAKTSKETSKSDHKNTKLQKFTGGHSKAKGSDKSHIIVDIEDDDGSDLEVVPIDGQCSKKSKLEILKRQMKSCSVVLDRNEITRYFKIKKQRADHKYDPDLMRLKTLGIKHKRKTPTSSTLPQFTPKILSHILKSNTPINSTLSVRCHACNVLFPNAQILRKHKAIVHKSEPFCIACSLYFKNQLQYAEHQQLCVYAINIPNTPQPIASCSNSDVTIIQSNTQNGNVPVKNKLTLKTVAQINESFRKILPSNNDNELQIISENVSGTSKFNDTESYTCTRCNHVYNSQVNLDRHIAMVHELKPCCKFCFVILQNKNEEKNHMKVCSKRTKNKTARFNGNLYVCKQCNIAYNHPSTLELHISVIHGKKPGCIFCNITYNNLHEEQTHMKMFHGPKNLNTFSVFTCNNCKLQMNSESAHKNHVKNCKGIICNLCGQTYFSKTAHTKHMIQKHKMIVANNFDCTDCSSKFISQEMLDCHIKFYHNGIINNQNRNGIFICKNCNVKMTSNIAYKKHMTICKKILCTLCGAKCKNQIAHKKHMLEKHDLVVDNDYTCKDCNTTLQSQQQLDTHIAANHGYKCGKCSQVFQTGHELSKHMNSSHMTENTFLKCYPCNKIFQNNKSFRDHIRRLHKKSSTNNLMCEICNIEFQNDITLILHNNTCHGHDTSLHYCIWCTSRFSSNDELVSHKAICRLSPTTSHLQYCPKCSIGFATTIDLNMHINICMNSIEEIPEETEGVSGNFNPLLLCETQLQPISYQDAFLQQMQMPKLDLVINDVDPLQFPSTFPVQTVQMPIVKNIHIPTVQSVQMPMINNIQISTVESVQMPIIETIQMSDIESENSVEMPVQPVEHVEMPVNGVDMSTEDVKIPIDIDPIVDVSDNSIDSENGEENPLKTSTKPKNTILLLKCPCCNELFQGPSKIMKLREHLCLDPNTSVKKYQVHVEKISFQKLKEKCTGNILRLADQSYQNKLQNVLKCTTCEFSCHFDCELLRHNHYMHSNV